jgi:hypothetical protein
VRLIIFAIYIAIGAMLHALFVGSHFDWNSAWTFGWLLGWPIMIFVAGWAFIIGGALVCAVVYGLWYWLKTFAEWREKRRTRVASFRNRDTHL